MGVNSLPKTVTRQRRGCDLNPGPSALESSTLTTRGYRATVSGEGANIRSLSPAESAYILTRRDGGARTLIYASDLHCVIWS